MEKGFESWFRDQQIDWQSPDPNSSSAPFGLGPRATIPSFGNMVSPKASVRQEPHGWFYGLPRFHQGFIPVVNSIAKELPVINPNEAGATNGAQKKFLVFDQSGDQTMLIYSSGVGAAPIRYRLSSLNNPKPQSGSQPFHVDKYIEENVGDDSRSEMREDTEELNALLYSDDDEIDYSENEETSTGHSPSSMTGFVGQKRQNESGEEGEVASSAGPAKRHKQEDGGYIVDALEDTASSGKSGINCSGDGGNGVFEEESDAFSSCNKRSRKEKMKETINLLHNLIPGDKNGKNALMVIDEAIHYLRSLKVKAKALGLDSL